MSELTDYFLTILESFESTYNDHNQIAAGISIVFLRIAVGESWTNVNTCANKHPNTWLMNGDKDWFLTHPVPAPDLRQAFYFNRVVRLADAIFTCMKNKVDGIDVMREGVIKRSDTRAVFRELEIASLLSMRGCSVKFIKTSNVRGEDFDLQVEVNGQRISVEVTEILDRALSFRTAFNKFRKKRSQVPSHSPAVLYINIPYEWTKNRGAMFLHIDAAIRQFFVRSRRYNIVIFVWDYFIPAGDGFLFRGGMQPIYSHVARHSISDVSVFLAQRDRWNDCSMSKSFLYWLRTQRAKAGVIG
jgi:hypothetical protein